MAKMTKAQARKRLKEAYDKVAKVALSQAGDNLSRADSINLYKLANDILKYTPKLK